MCDCINEVNGMLAGHNTRLAQISLFSMKTGSVRESIHIATEKVGKKGKAKVMLPTFCPFCGEKIAKDEAPAADAA